MDQDAREQAIEWRQTKDVLSAVVGMVGLHGLVLSTVSLGAPWRVQNPEPPIPVLHVVGTGTAFVSTPGTPSPIELHAGDVVLLPSGGQYELVDTYPSRVETPSDVPNQKGGARCSVRLGGAGPRTELTCCAYRFDSPTAAPLLKLLPEMVVMRALDQSADVRPFLDLLVRESQTSRPGTEGMVSRLAELVLLLVLRTHFENEEPSSAGLLAATSDPQIGAALGLIHGSLESPWTVESLATNVGMSRAAFSQMFTAKVGVSPIRYIQMCRIQLATRLLVDSEMSLGEIGRRVGYSDPTAFSRAFRREVGVPAREYRAGRSQPST